MWGTRPTTELPPLSRAILPGAPGEPNATCRYSEPSQNFEDYGNLGVVLKKVPAGENGIPIVIAATDEGKLHAPGVGGGSERC